MYQVKIPLPEGLTLAHLMDTAEKRDSLYPGKSYAAYPLGGATPQKLATELNAVWHGQATAMDAVRLFFGPDVPDAIGQLLGTYYLIHILGLTLEETKEFLKYNTPAYWLGIARQSWLANSGDRDTLKQMWFKGPIDWVQVSNFNPDCLSFWQKYYDIFAGRREADLKFLADCGFDAVYTWLRIFHSANLCCGVIIMSLHNDIVRIK